MHITYEYRKRLGYLDMNRSMRSPNLLQNRSLINPPAANESALNFVDKRISDLKLEEAAILQVCTKLSQFLQANSITPFNDDILEYLRYFIHEEKLKQNAGANNAEVIRGLESIVTQYTSEMDLFKKLVNDKAVVMTNSQNQNNLPHIDKIFDLVESLYALPINGPQIREQVDGLKFAQVETITQQEVVIQLPVCAASSPVMKQLQEVVNYEH
ncbi:unnamed protein product [Adineta steineri]|uniref:Uncharacterized protein n=1 Tax=Adineta steineri TaxID=433720 RepID=A0A815B489_9BILA|nr:unnamed protein product [Adineta steineri]CAF4034794.1 unnamed protein product [Adineta steineri]